MAVQVSGLDCRSCTENLKRKRGCEGYPPVLRIDPFTGERVLAQCPLVELRKANLEEFYDAYSFYKTGNLGNPFELPNKLVEGILLIDREVNRKMMAED